MEQNILVKQPHRTGRLAYCPECKQIQVREVVEQDGRVRSKEDVNARVQAS